MRRSRRKPAIFRTASMSGWRLAAIVLAILTFSLQSYTTQTHVHFDPPAGWSPAQGASKQAPNSNYPFHDTPENCPICQDMLLAGHYVTPTAIVFVLPSQTVAIIPIEIATSFIVEAVSHDWRGRAPPQH